MDGYGRGGLAVGALPVFIVPAARGRVVRRPRKHIDLGVDSQVRPPTVSCLALSFPANLQSPLLNSSLG